jgi:D-alanine-D-alanine ligase-like ATP-grasp enzyme
MVSRGESPLPFWEVFALMMFPPAYDWLANVHTGGTIADVTDELHPTLLEVAVRAAHAIDIPVIGVDLMVPDLGAPDYVIIEGNEQPGLANHEPRPTAARFVDLLFPETRAS